MTRTKIIGVNIILFVVIFFASCISIKNMRKEVVVLDDTYKYYVIDSLNFSYRFFGSYYRIDDKKIIRKSIRQIDKKLPLINCIDCYKTFSNPVWPNAVHCNFYFSNPKLSQKKKLLNSIKEESNAFYLDTNKFVVGKYIPLERDKGCFFIIGRSFGRSEKKGLDDAFLSNYSDIFRHIVTNEKYRDIEQE